MLTYPILKKKKRRKVLPQSYVLLLSCLCHFCSQTLRLLHAYCMHTISSHAPLNRGQRHPSTQTAARGHNGLFTARSDRHLLVLIPGDLHCPCPPYFLGSLDTTLACFSTHTFLPPSQPLHRTWGLSMSISVGSDLRMLSFLFSTFCLEKLIYSWLQFIY